MEYEYWDEIVLDEHKAIITHMLDDQWQGITEIIELPQPQKS